jgi:AGZA family xanthine/uracil permease-like MFS transporter
MGARSGYTLLAGLVVGAGGMLGYLGNLIEIVPIAALAPVLVFVAADITTQAFRSVPERHAAAVVVSLFPSIARMLTIELSAPEILPPTRFAQLLLGAEHSNLPVIVALGNGFIITATLWGAVIVEMIERRLGAAAGFLLAGAGLCVFGIIHSVQADGGAYLLWQLQGPPRTAALQFCSAYIVLAAALLALSLQHRRWQRGA